MQAANQPGACRFPVTLDRDQGDAQDFRDIFFAQAAEESQLHDAGGTGVDGSELRQRRVEGEDVLALRHGLPSIDGRQTDALLLAPALLGHARARVVDEDPSHGLRRNREEVRPVLVRDRLASEETDTELVHQRARFERMIAALVAQETCRNLAQVGMNDVEEPLARVIIATPPIDEPFSDLRRGGRRVFHGCGA